MANINVQPSFKANIGYDGHNLTHRLKFSSSVGQLLPVLKDILQPGDKITINSTMRSRTMEIDSAAFTNLYDCIDYFYVPIEQLYSPFGSLFFGVDDRKTSLIGNKSDIGENFPFLDTNDIFYSFWDEAINFGNSTWTDDFGWKAQAGSLRLLEHLGVPVRSINSVPNESDPKYFSQPFSLMWIAAYNKIFNDFYRLDDRFTNNPKRYNLDRYYTYSTAIPEEDWDENLVGMFTLRYRPLNKDVYTNNYVTPIIPAGYNAISSQPQYTKSLINSANMADVSNWLGTMDDIVTSSNENLDNVPSSVTDNLGAVTTANIRSIFAIDKLLEVTRRAGKNVDQQTLAHFGVKVNDYMTDKVRYLGTHRADIHIGEVIATATTDASPLGEIAGKGYAYKESDKPITFTADKHGILLGIYSCVPEIDYTQTGYDKLLSVINRIDLPIPEYDHLGMQPLFTYQYSVMTTDSNGNSSQVDVSNIANWQYRFMEWKTRNNTVITGLKETDSLGYWTPQRNFANMDLTYPNQSWFYLIPSTYLNGIMLVDYDPEEDTIADMYNKDPLIHEFYFNYKKASKMSTYGLENL